MDYCRQAEGFSVTLLVAPPDECAVLLLAGRVERIVTGAQVEILPVDPSRSIPRQ